MSKERDMRIFVAATSVVPPNAELEIKQGKRGRIDYLELCARLGAPYIDYGLSGSGQGRLRRIEEKLRLDIFQALQVARQVRKQKCDVVLSLSERIAMPLAY